MRIKFAAKTIAGDTGEAGSFSENLPPEYYTVAGIDGEIHGGCR